MRENAERQRHRRQHETSDIRAARLHENAERQQHRRQLETSEHRASRLQENAERQQYRRQLETAEQRASRLKENAESSNTDVILRPPSSVLPDCRKVPTYSTVDIRMKQLRKGHIGCMNTLKGNSRGEAQKILPNELLDWKGVCDEIEKDDIRTIDGTVYATFADAAKAAGFLDDD
ncbi:hypothetical protein GCK32_022435, partial [Trichostrongylus colubriformis]